MSLMNKLKSETDKSDTGASSAIGSILTTDTSKEQELLNQANKALKNTKYELFPDVFANEEQTKALDNLDTFVKAPRDKSEKYQSTFVLVGAAGTGKTTIVKKILELNPNKKVVGAAVSNAAKNVLNNSLRKGNVTTIASLVGYKENRATGKYELDPKFELAKSPIKKAEILIIDETSMISKEMIAAIYNLAPANCKIIFMGDNKQLPPIGEKDDSQTFNAASKPEYNAKLTQRMRQDEDSPIVGLSDIIGANIEKALNEIKRRVISRRVSDFNPITNKGLLFATVNEFYSELKKDLLADIQNTKIIGYTNALRETMNNTARELIWGEQGAKNEYNVGEILVANDLKYDKGIINGEYYKVTSVTPSPTSVNIEVLNVVNGQARISPMSFPGYRLAVEVISDGDNFGKTIYLNLPTKESKTAIDKYQKSYADNKQWGIFYRNRDVLFDVDYGYAITSHKAQGSTINNAYVMEDDIVDSQMSNKEVNQSLNVAVTRPRNKAVIYSQYNKPTSEEKLSAEEISRMESTGESFQPKEEFVTSEANVKALLRQKGIIDKYLNIIDLGKFRSEHLKLRNQIKEYFPNFNDKLFIESDNGKKAYPNKEAFKKLDKLQGINYQPAEEVTPLALPEYKIDTALQNKDGSKRFASTSRDGVITINPVTSTKEFFDYFEGKEGGITSQQKAKVLEQLSNQGWSLDRIKSVLKDSETINNFLVLHEQSHVENKDIDVYWSMGKDLLTEDKIKIEARATIDALNQIENAPKEVKQKAQQTQKDVVSSAIENQIDELIRKGIIKAKCD